ncbi:hypothetical protein D3D02_17065 [Halobellus sp. Atlit-38R]|uniref:hypothetical protein n=1 Tax=Halobellus sp. Atlit-38R TaxID=2282131 RepID=UPI000EF1943C|nr:hypothetical protein [Halobellus sp. Atlit-38R]RLM83713.1 hypothetical protein D3D02_17065 [Halobellus sp. Atlit-38R]
MVDWERHKITAETTMIRGKGWLNLLIRLAGMSLLVIAAVNLMLLGPEPIFSVYRDVFYTITGGDPSLGGRILADFIAMGIGAAIANFL